MKLAWLSIGLGLALALSQVACGGDDDDTGDDNPAGPCTDDNSLCATLHVPTDYAGTPKKIIVGFYDSEIPATGPAGPPKDVGAIIEDPAPNIAPGMPLAITATDMTMKGDFYVYIVLYNEGGGNFQPTKNIDYVVQSTAKVKVGSGPINMGDMQLALFK